MARSLHVRLDDSSAAALDVVRAEGMSDSEAVRAALREAAARRRVRSAIREEVRRILGLDADHGLGMADLPAHHRDPFDRLLISQARCEGLTVVTADPRLAQYDIALIDAAA